MPLDNQLSTVKKRVVDVVTATTRMTGGSWTLLTSSTDVCRVDDGSRGDEYTRLVGDTAGFDDPDAIAAQVAAFWKSRGYEGVVVGSNPKGDPEVHYSEGAHGQMLVFSVNTVGATIEASGGCVVEGQAS